MVAEATTPGGGGVPETMDGAYDLRARSWHILMRKTTTATGTHRTTLTREQERLLEHRQDKRDWKRWGPYVSDRAWGTVREDYSTDGSAWTFLTHDMARSKAYRWGEDGIAGLCDGCHSLLYGLESG